MPRKITFTADHNTMRGQLAQRINENGAGIMAICKAANVNHSNVYDFLQGHHSTRIETVERLCIALNCQVFIVPREG